MSIDHLVRSTIVGLQPYLPGTTVDQVQKLYGLSHIVKLSSNENPWGSSPRALAAIHDIAQLNIYMNDAYPQVRDRLAQRYACAPENLILGHGSNEILALLFATFVNPGEEIVMANPSFSLYRSDAVVHGGVPVEIPLRDGVHDLEAMADAVTARTKMVIVCDPNNPTGTQVDPDDFDRFLRRLPATTLLVLDQAYREYARGGVDGIEIAKQYPNCVVLRTASKAWGLAALRFGYALTSPEIAGWTNRMRLPFNVAAPAAAGILAALDDDEFLQHSIAMNTSERARLVAAFEKLGLSSYPSEANFVAVRVPTTATAAYDALLRQGVIVRSGDGLRLPQYLRITVGRPEENDALLTALEGFLAGVSPDMLVS